MKRKIMIMIVVHICLSCLYVYTEQTGLEVSVRNLDTRAIVGKQWLVIIAINQYREWLNLQYPVPDAKILADVVTHRYYIDEVITLFDQQASKRQITQLFLELQEKVNIHDSLLIYFSGHGYLDTNSKSGFWIPCDAGSDTISQRNWLPNTQIRGYISQIKSMHICLIVDACFSGDILEMQRGAPDTISNEYFQKAYKRTSRQVLTSGALEFVPDKSEFTFLLTQTLEKNTSLYIDPLMLFDEIRLGIRKTTPLLGNLKLTGHQDGASFLLFLKDSFSYSPLQEEKNSMNQIKTQTEDEAYGNAIVTVRTKGKLLLDQKYLKTISAGSPAFIEHIKEGEHVFTMKYDKDIEETKTIQISKDRTITIDFIWGKKDTPHNMVYVKGGMYEMGSGEGAQDERPVHKVIVNDFYISRSEVTFHEYEKFCESTGCTIPKDNGWGMDKHPVIYVSWYDAVHYCNWLSKKENLTPCYIIDGKNVLWQSNTNGYRLPTEAEWEYAARGGGYTNRGYKYAGNNDPSVVGWYNQNSGRETHPAGMKIPNELGIYDMSGNVWEWCWDFYDDDYYLVTNEKNPTGPVSGKKRVLRGGSWYNGSTYLTVTVRGYAGPTAKDDYFGFRLVRTVE